MTSLIAAAAYAGVSLNWGVAQRRPFFGMAALLTLHLAIVGMLTETGLYATILDFRVLYPAMILLWTLVGSTYINIFGLPPLMPEKAHTPEQLRAHLALLCITVAWLPLILMPSELLAWGLTAGLLLIAYFIAFWLLQHTAAFKPAGNAKKMFRGLLLISLVLLAACFLFEVVLEVDPFWVPVTVGFVMILAIVMLHVTQSIRAPPGDYPRQYNKPIIIFQQG